jgi:Homeodomain-like domain
MKAMAGWRQAIEPAMGEEDLAALRLIARSRTEPASRVERARMLMAYRENPSFFAVGQALGVDHQTVQRCVERALAYGAMAVLDDLPRPGREPTITAEAKAWIADLACRKAKDLGYPHELWTTRLLARHAREHGPAEGHPCLDRLAQGTLCKILNAQEITAQGPILPGTPRSGGQKEDGRGSVRLSRGEIHQRGRGGRQTRAKRCDRDPLL